MRIASNLMRILCIQAVRDMSKYKEALIALTGLSALLHDIGKCNNAFQNKLKGTGTDIIRHEFVSCLILLSIMKVHGTENLAYLHAIADNKLNIKAIQKVLSSFKTEELMARNAQRLFKHLDNISLSILFLILTHHKLLQFDIDTAELLAQETHNIHEYFSAITTSNGFVLNITKLSKKALKDNLSFRNDILLFDEKCTAYNTLLRRYARKVLQCSHLINQAFGTHAYKVLLKNARLSLMLGDYFYSSQRASNKQFASENYANTDNDGNLKQRLDEHLYFVTKHATCVAYAIDDILDNRNPSDNHINTDFLEVRSPIEKFMWQDVAIDTIAQDKKQNKHRANYFVVNQASTGCGKTLANAKIMNAIKDGDINYILAVGLRTLTLQTAKMYVEKVGFDKKDVATVVGMKAFVDLHKKVLSEDNASLETISESSEYMSNYADDEICFFDEYKRNAKAFNVAFAKKHTKISDMLNKNIIVCTIDMLMQASECSHGGKHIVPELAILKNDIALDEIDEYNTDDILAITRLAYHIGLHGKNLLISSATVTKDIVFSMLNAYNSGLQAYNDYSSSPTLLKTVFVDEFSTQLNTSSDIHEIHAEYDTFIANRISKLKQQHPKHIACVINIDEQYFKKEKGERKSYFFSQLLSAANDLHKTNHRVINDKKISFGLISLNNISNTIGFVHYLNNAIHNLSKNNDCKVYFCTYTANNTIYNRTLLEKQLASVLQTSSNSHEYNSVIIDKINQTKENDIMFLCVASPVINVGNDFDFDYAVTEPSSYYSLVQLSGRVYRHRQNIEQKHNISIMQFNYKHFVLDKLNCFSRPGFETNTEKLEIKDVGKLLIQDNNSNQYISINAIGRLNENVCAFSDFEHIVIKKKLKNVNYFIQSDMFFTNIMSVTNKFRQNNYSEVVWVDDKNHQLTNFDKENVTKSYNFSFVDFPIDNMLFDNKISEKTSTFFDAISINNFYKNKKVDYHRNIGFFLKNDD